MKKTLPVQGTMKTPRREARLISETLRKPKPQTVKGEEKKEGPVYSSMWKQEESHCDRGLAGLSPL